MAILIKFLKFSKILPKNASKKSARSVPLADVAEVREGQTTAAFARQAKSRPGQLPAEGLCFSLLTRDRTVDLAPPAGAGTVAASQVPRIPETWMRSSRPSRSLRATWTKMACATCCAMHRASCPQWRASPDPAALASYDAKLRKWWDHNTQSMYLREGERKLQFQQWQDLLKNLQLEDGCEVATPTGIALDHTITTSLLG